MFKRTWIMMMVALALAIVLSACGSGELAEELTPIPTLPPGQTPALVDALEGGAVPAAADTPATEETGAQPAEAPDPALGEELFAQCSGCHGVQDGVGPAVTGMGERATTEVEGQSAEEYLRAAIVNPCDYVVDGYACMMQPYEFSAHELDSLVAYLLTQ